MFVRIVHNLIRIKKMVNNGDAEPRLSLSEHSEYGNGMVQHLEGQMSNLRHQLSNHIDHCLVEAFSEILHLSVRLFNSMLQNFS